MRRVPPGRILPLLAAAALSASAAYALRIGVKPGSAVQFTIPEEVSWSPDPVWPPCAATALLREGPAAGSELRLLRLKARCGVPERAWAGPASIVVVKGRLAVRAGDLKTTLRPGGSAFLPARTPHSLRSGTLLRDTWLLVSVEAADGR
ncbi:MAG: hypothetical protein A2X36_13525 [Elusimicrobia bacterium GWA2_69_24]|nr:MAG: hypothetical protein A2X36_13525 [Elusimicrobia bacterium GWA2_69_24]HBL15426.1 hypothetical protein [Elusimicrobiota bacterium]